MSPADFATLRAQLKSDEGLRLFPYVDIVGKISIGYGRNLTDTGISQLEACDLLDQDITRAVSDLQRTYPVFNELDAVRQIVLGNMCFNLGLTKLGLFVQFWKSLNAHDYQGAATAMLESRWAEEVGARATRLSSAMATGEFA